jgi:hypothetical protein
MIPALADPSQTSRAAQATSPVKNKREPDIDPAERLRKRCGKELKANVAASSGHELEAGFQPLKA